MSMVSPEPLKEPLLQTEGDESVKAQDRGNYTLAVAFSFVPFAFNCISKVITKQIASTKTAVEYEWLGVHVPVGTAFLFPVFLATVQFFGNAFGALLTYKWFYKGSIRAELSKALHARVAGRLVFSKAASSIGAKSGLMGMPLSLYAVSRSLTIPVTQGFRIALLKKPITQIVVLQTLLVFGGVALCFLAQDMISADELKTHATVQAISLSFVATFLILGVLPGSLHGVYTEQVFDENNLHPLVTLAFENFAACFACFLLWPVFSFIGFESMGISVVSFVHSPDLQCLVLGLLGCKFITNTCATFTIYYGDAFQRIALQRPAKIGSQFCIELVAYYCFHNVNIGRPWVNPWSFLVLFSISMVIWAAAYKEKKDKKNKKKNKQVEGRETSSVLSSLVAGTVMPHKLLGTNPKDFMSVMQSICPSSAAVEFANCSILDEDMPPMVRRTLDIIKEHVSLDQLEMLWRPVGGGPAVETVHLNVMLVQQGDARCDQLPGIHCKVPHAVCVLDGAVQGIEASGASTELQCGNLMISRGETYYKTGSAMPGLAILLSVGGPLLSDAQKLCSVSLAKVSQLAKNGAGDWQTDAGGAKIDWAADGMITGVEKITPDASPITEVQNVPSLLKAAFDPEYVLGMKATSFASSLRTLRNELPLQVHFEPAPLNGNGESGLTRRAVDAVAKLDALKELMENSGSDKVRVKMRLSGGGKFIHRNRYKRQQAFAILSGEMHWLLVDSQSNGGAADSFLSAVQNDNWNGYRCPTHPKMLSLEEMHEMRAKLPAGVESRILKVCAGDVLIFDGRWWHATNYTEQAFSMFLTPGKDMEVAVSEHERRMKMPKQSKLKICNFFKAQAAT